MQGWTGSGTNKISVSDREIVRWQWNVPKASASERSKDLALYVPQKTGLTAVRVQ